MEIQKKPRRAMPDRINYVRVAFVVIAVITGLAVLHGVACEFNIVNYSKILGE